MLIAAGIVIAALVWALAGSRDDSAGDSLAPLPHAWQRGANLTTYSPGGYGTPATGLELERLAELGVDHVALMPLWYMPTADASTIAPDAARATSDEALLAATRRARELGRRAGRSTSRLTPTRNEAANRALVGPDWFLASGGGTGRSTAPTPTAAASPRRESSPSGWSPRTTSREVRGGVG